MRRSRFRRRSRRPRATTARTTRASRPTRPAGSLTDDFSRRDIDFHRATARAYDRDVTREYAVYHERLVGPFLDRVARARPGGRALDLGCGTGVLTVALAGRGLETVGIDHSEEMLAIARSKLASEGLAATVETGDVRALRFRDAEFDCVTCQGLLHHLESLEPCLRELDRVLRPGGFFFLSEPSRQETPVKRFLHGLWRVLPHRRRRDAQAAAPESLEHPIDADELRAVLDRLELRYDVEFLTHVPPLRRRLPDRLYLLTSRILTLPWRRRKGDLVFVFGEKPSG
jgi:ubiquinone/menaquinone biosynthesis C-methylase UbiE